MQDSRKSTSKQNINNLSVVHLITLVDSSRKSVTHPADPSSPHQPVAQTEEAGDKSMTGPRKTVETIVPPQDRSKATPQQSPIQQEAPGSQGENVLMFEGLYLNPIKRQETRHKTKSCFHFQESRKG